MVPSTGGHKHCAAVGMHIDAPYCSPDITKCIQRRHSLALPMRSESQQKLSAREQLAAQAIQLEKLQETCSHMKARVAAVEQQIKVKSSEAAAAVDMAAELASELHQIQTELSAAQADRQKYKAAAAAAKQHSKALESALEQYKNPQQQLNELQQRLEAQQQLLQEERANHEMTQQREAQTAAALTEGHERLRSALSTLAVSQQDLQHMHAEAELLEAQVLAADTALAQMIKTAATTEAQLQKHITTADTQQQKLREQLSLALSAAAAHKWVCGRLASHNHSLKQQLEESALQQQEAALAAAATISRLQQTVDQLQARVPAQQQQQREPQQQQQQQNEQEQQQQPKMEKQQQEQWQSVQGSAAVAAPLNLQQLEQAYCKLPAKAAPAQQGPYSPAYSEGLGDVKPASDVNMSQLTTPALHSCTSSSTHTGDSLAHIHTLLLAAAAAPVTAGVLAATAAAATAAAPDAALPQQDSCALLLQPGKPQCNSKAAEDLLLLEEAGGALQRCQQQWGSELCTSCSEEDIHGNSSSSRNSSRPNSRHSSRHSSRPSSRRSSITSWYSCSSRGASRGSEGEQLVVPGQLAAQAPVVDTPKMD